jgi:hypothetical protein
MLLYLSAEPQFGQEKWMLFFRSLTPMPGPSQSKGEFEGGRNEARVNKIPYC